MSQSQKKFFLSYIVVVLGLINSLKSAINFSNQTGTIRFNKTNSKFILSTPITNFDGMLELKDNVAATISSTNSSNITFAGGIIKTGTVSSVFKGTFDPTSTDKFTLGNGDYLVVDSGSIVQAVEVSASSTAAIYGEPIFSSSPSLLAATSTLNLGITTPLNQTISGLGTLGLLADLRVAKSIQLPSNVNLNGKVLYLAGGTLSSGITVSGGGSIEFGGYTNISAPVTIGSGSEVYNLNGNGSVIDFSGTGGITFNGVGLYLNDIHIRGMSTANAIKGTGTIYLSKVTIELAADFLRNDGDFYVFGDPCKLVTNGYTFTMSGAGNDLIIDGVTLYYEQVSGSGANPFLTASSALITYLSGGSIASAFGSTNENLTVPGTSWTLGKDFFLSTSTKIFFTNATPLVSKSVAFSGAGQFVSFPFNVGTYISLADNEQVTFSNIVFKNFYPAVYSIGTSASVSYGDGARLELGPDLTIASGDKAWTFTGNAEIDGQGATLYIDKANGITITGAKTLTLKNMRIVVSVVDAIKALTDTATIAFQNVELVLKDAGFNLSAGNMTVTGLLKITGGALTTNPSTIFELSTTGSCTINANSQMFIDRNVTLKYNCDPTNDVTFAATKRHLVMTNSNSVLNLCGCGIESTGTGLGLDLGTVQIQDKVSLVTSTNAGEDAEFGSGLNVNLSSGAILDVNGTLRYIA